MIKIEVYYHCKYYYRQFSFDRHCLHCLNYLKASVIANASANTANRDYIDGNNTNNVAIAGTGANSLLPPSELN